MGHIRFDKSGSDGVAANIAAAQFQGDGLGETDDSCLGGSITGVPRVSADSDYGTHIYNGASSCLHRRTNHLLGHIEYTLQVDSHYFIPLLGSQTEQQIILGNSCIVDADVYCAELPDYFVDQG